MFVVAHISDLHFNGTRFNRSRIESTLRYINTRADGINALVVTGDIADRGTDEEYVEAFETLISPLPMVITAGNHDQREQFNAGLLRAPGSAPVNWAQIIDGVLFVMVDSSVPGRQDGFIPDTSIEWIDEEIQRAGHDIPVFVAFHHPPILLHMPVMDAIRQTGEQRLAGLVERHPNIVAFLCGHAHTGAVSTFAGRPLCLAPGVSSTLNLPFEGTDVVNHGQPPGIAFHILDEQRLTTHFRAVMD